MAWKNHKKYVHRKRIAKRYVREFFNWRLDRSFFRHDVLDYVDKSKYETKHSYYSEWQERIVTFSKYDSHTALKDISIEEDWKIQEEIRKKNLDNAKKLPGGGYRKNRRSYGLSSAKSFFGLNRRYDKHIKHVGKYGTEEDWDELSINGSCDPRLGWWD